MGAEMVEDLTVRLDRCGRVWTLRTGDKRERRRSGATGAGAALVKLYGRA